MAKEMLITFLYDTQYVQKEEDDPALAILYFHPSWVSDQQKAALCGQVIGTIQCLKNVFALPKIVALQSGKFYIIENGRFLLAVGTDRNVADWLLEHRAKSLYSLLNFSHKDFVSLQEFYPNRESFSAKMYHIFETYLKMLVFGGNLFSHLPSLTLPKSASNVFTEAIQLLECCQELNNVLGGSMLYHNKVVATQLSADLTKRLVLTDPYRIKSTAEPTKVDFDLPLGVQLLQVFISSKEYSNLLEKSIRNRSIFQYLTQKSIKKVNIAGHQDPTLISTMKRDQSLIFTAVPEEDATIENQPFLPTGKKPRPKFLNLKSITMEPEVKPAPKTPFNGQTSVCSTPMTELKRFIHQNPLSICVNEELDEQAKNKPIFELTTKPYKVTTTNQKRASLTDLTKLHEKGELRRSLTIHDPENPIFKTQTVAMSRVTFNEVSSNKETKTFKGKKVILNNKERRKSLSLPLKSLSETPVSTKKISYGGGVQLTPLMSKLSMLAFEERSSGFYSREATPLVEKQNFPFISKKIPIEKLLEEEEKENCLEKVVLFVCGQQDVVLLLLLREDCGQSQEVIKKLWEICTDELGRLEKQLNYCMEAQPGGVSHETEPYSFLCLDQDWDTVQRGGPWGGDQSSLSGLHKDFLDPGQLTEILVRASDSIIYGYHCGQTEVFYHESAPANAGLPTPADAMGMVQLKAKRKLERDHAIILL